MQQHGRTSKIILNKRHQTQTLNIIWFHLFRKSKQNKKKKKQTIETESRSVECLGLRVGGGIDSKQEQKTSWGNGSLSKPSYGDGCTNA